MTERDYHRLIGCDLVLIRAVKNVLDRMAAEGTPMMVTPDGGARTVSQQAILWAKGRTYADGRWRITDKLDVVTYCDGVVRPSNHQGGRACDCAFVGPDPFAESHPWERYGEVAEDEGLVWGGRWPEPKTDEAHVELQAPEKAQVLKV